MLHYELHVCLLKKSMKFFVCKFVQVYEWFGRSVIRRDIIAKLLVAFREETHAVLQIPSVRWLSRGLVMERLNFCMPAILEA